LDTLLESVGRLVLALAATTAAALGLPHAVLDVVRRGVLRQAVLIHPRLAVLVHPAFHLGRLWRRTLVHLHLGFILL
jgi:hypothetical protein